MIRDSDRTSHPVALISWPHPISRQMREHHDAARNGIAHLFQPLKGVRIEDTAQPVTRLYALPKPRRGGLEKAPMMRTQGREAVDHEVRRG